MVPKRLKVEEELGFKKNKLDHCFFLLSYYNTGSNNNLTMAEIPSALSEQELTAGM